MTADSTTVEIVNTNQVEEQRLVVQGGALLSDLDAALKPYNCFVPVGTCPSTGLGGLALLGGRVCRSLSSSALPGVLQCEVGR